MKTKSENIIFKVPKRFGQGYSVKLNYPPVSYNTKMIDTRIKNCYVKIEQLKVLQQEIVKCENDAELHKHISKLKLINKLKQI